MTIHLQRRMVVCAFTLIELLVSTAIIALLMVVLAGITDQTSRTWRGTTAKIEQFQQARAGFESMTRRLSQATLNTYWDVIYNNNSSGVSVPEKYTRQSELRFISGPAKNLSTGTNKPTHAIFFQSPLGFVDNATTYGALDNLLNTWGYFLEVGDDSDSVPSFVSKVSPLRWRSRLYEFMQPAERMSVYQLKGTENGAAARVWFTDGLNANPRPARVLAENIIAMVILPKLAKSEESARATAGKKGLLSPKYTYDSTLPYNVGSPANDPDLNPKNQLPPVVQVTMVAISEASAQHLDEIKPKAVDLGLNMSALFADCLKLEDDPATPTPGDGDLATLEKQLVSLRVTYRVFTSEVSIRGAKWSRSQ